MDYNVLLKEFRAYLVDNYAWSESLREKYDGKDFDLHLIYEQQCFIVGAILDRFDIYFNLDDTGHKEV